MKRLLSVVGFLFVAAPIYAQPTQVQSTNSSEAGQWGGGSLVSTTPNFGSTVTLNNYILVEARACANSSCSTTNPTGSIKISDTLGLLWQACSATTGATRQSYLAFFIAKITTTGSEAITGTCSGCSGIYYGGIYAHEFNGTGLTNTAGLCDVSGEVDDGSTTLGSGTFSVSTSAATNFSGEFVVSDVYTFSGGCSTVPSGWTALGGTGGFNASLTGAAGSTQTATWTGCTTTGQIVEAVIATFHNGTPPCSGTSPNLTAADWAHVQGCHDNVAVTGDTITVTSGSYTVTTNTSLTKAITVQAQGGAACNLASPSVTLTDNTANLSDMIDITESSAGSAKLVGFCVTQGTAQHSNPNGVIRLISNSGKPILVTGNYYTTNSANGDFIIANVNQGVINLNGMIGFPQGVNCNNQNAFVRHKLSGFNSFWTSALSWGSADTLGNKWLYIEGNNVKFTNQAIDVDDNATTVIRYNTLTNSAEITHGTDTSGPQGGRAVDFSHNLWINDQTTTFAACVGAPIQTNDENGYISVHNGTAQIHNNSIPDPSSAWGSHAAIAFFVESLRRIGNVYSCWGTRTGGGAGYPEPHQVGWGWTTGSTTIGPFNTFPLPGSSFSTSVVQDSEPVYLWNNVGTGNYANPSLGDFPTNVPGTSCNNQVATFSGLVAGSGYSNASAVGTTDTTGGAQGNSLAVDITTTGGGVTGLTLENGALLYGQLYNVGDVLRINGGGNNATFNVASIKWSDTTMDLPKTSDYVQSGRDFKTATAKPGYSDAPCPNINAGLTGTCDASNAGAIYYNINAHTMTFTVQPSPIQSGKTFSPVVTLTVNPVAADQIALTSSCGTLTGTTTVTTSSQTGVATFNGLGMTGLSASCTILATNNTDATISPVTSNAFAITCAPTKVVFTAQPANAALGASLGTVSVTEEDNSGNICSLATDSITLSKDAGATWGTLASASSLSKTASAGVATWTDLSVTTTAGTGSIDAASSGLTGATSNSITISGSSCTPDHLAFISQPVSALLGQSIGTIQVAVKDVGGNTCNDTSTITIAKHAGTCTGMTLNGTLSGAASAGVFATSNVNVAVATGLCSLDATDGALTGATSNIFTILQPGIGVGGRAPAILRRHR